MKLNNATSIKTLRLTKLAFAKVKPTSEHKRETLLLAFEQIKPILKEYMKENHILAIELDLKNRKYLVLEPIPNVERNFWVEQWLSGELSTRRFKAQLKRRFQWVQFLSFSDFLSGVEAWLMGKVIQHGF
jgi:regulator of replication initiation timing